MNNVAFCQSSRGRAIQRHSTVDAYAKDVRQFTQTYGGTIPCTADELISYIQLLARRVAPSTIVRRVMALQDAHVKQGHAPPTTDERIKTAMRSLAKGKPPENLLIGKRVSYEVGAVLQKSSRVAAPITRALLMRMLDSMGTGKRSLDRRDKAIFLLGYVGGLKRGAICALNLEDLSFTADALLLRLRSAAGADSLGFGAPPSLDQEAATVRMLAVPFTRGPLCAATACQEWIAHNGLEGRQGPLFPRFARSGEPVLDERLDSAYVSTLCKRRLMDAGIADVSSYSGESLRRGYELESKSLRRR
ncbi:MAG TPA: hypothetical protein VE934_16290 [Polaromonas sp.]|uniref:hypothetical protein n=1 Tax=Polaromonas sp. TaxID=1869339 RepID=UPI002D668FFF|nr:hypothetical protein [Polaromonas sp.]HYW58514.1 hypothetical protein [Polaromonas sp.]